MSPDKIAHRTRFASRKDSISELTQPPLDIKRQNPSDYIAPLNRRLGQYENLFHAVSSTEVTGPVDFGLQKAVGLVVKSRKPEAGFSGEFLQELTNLTSEYMGQLFQLLHELTEIQRHHRPGIADLEMCLRQHNLSATDLGREYDRTAVVSPAVKTHSKALNTQVDALLHEFYAENYHLDKDDPSLVFHANEQYEVAALVPRQSKKRTYIPSYLPELPPDFTYQYTGNYMKTLTDLKEIKLKLVEESRLNEASLYKLIDEDEDKAWTVASDLDSDLDDIMSEVEPVSDVESPIHEKEADKELPETEMAAAGETAAKDEAPLELRALPKPDKKFDLVAYARSRRLAKQRQAREIENRRKKRRHNVFMRAERLFSCYADRAPSSGDREFINSTLQRGFKTVIQATRRAEQEKKKKIMELLALKAKAEQEHEQNNAIEFGFAFNHASNLSDSDDDEEPQEFDFGDHEFDFGDGDKGKEADKQDAEPQPATDEKNGAHEGEFEFGENDFFAEMPGMEDVSDGDIDGDINGVGHMDGADHMDGMNDMDKMDNELDSALNEMENPLEPMPPAQAWSEEWHADAKLQKQDDSDEDKLEDL